MKPGQLMSQAPSHTNRERSQLPGGSQLKRQLTPGGHVKTVSWQPFRPQLTAHRSPEHVMRFRLQSMLTQSTQSVTDTAAAGAAGPAGAGAPPPPSATVKFPEMDASDRPLCPEVDART